MALLEFLQWLKWYFNSQHGEIAQSNYGDPVSKRKQQQVTNGSSTTGAPSMPQALKQNMNVPNRLPNSRNSIPSGKNVQKEFFFFENKDDKSSRSSKKELAELKVINTALERERDFYFGKLRDLEIACDKHRCTIMDEEDNEKNQSALELLNKLHVIFGPSTPDASSSTPSASSSPAMKFWKTQEAKSSESTHSEQDVKSARDRAKSSDQNSPFLLLTPV